MELYNKNDADVLRISIADLNEIVSQIFSSFGMSPEDSMLAADVLIKADMRGVLSHGVSRMLQVYADEYQAGKINVKPNLVISEGALSVANIDGDGGLGIVIAPKAMAIAIEKAKNTGIGMVNIYNSRHLGMASYHAMLALSKNMIGICMTACPPRCFPTFGAEEKLGTNPIAIAAPSTTEPHFVFDAATSVISYNTMQLARKFGIALPAGTVADEHGVSPSSDRVPTEGDSLLPLGSARETGSHKGYGLACMVDILCGILSGWGYGYKVGRPNYSHMVMAINIDSFSPYKNFTKLLQEYLQELQDTKPMTGQTRVLFPGLLEWEKEIENTRLGGVILHKGVVDWMRQYLKNIV